LKNLVIISTLLWLLNYKEFIDIFAQNESFFTALYEIFSYYIIILFSSSLFSFNKVTNILFLNLLLVLSLISVYFINTMGIYVDGDMLNNVFSTNSSEAFELLDIYFYIYILISALVVYFLNIKLIINSHLRLKEYSIFMFSLLIVAFIVYKSNREVLDRFINVDTPKIVPTFIFPAISDYYILKSKEEKINKKNISSEYTLTNDSNDSIILFILGESTRGDRFALNGYVKNTTPKLSQEKNLVSINNVSSCDTSTLNSIPCLMTRVTHDNYNGDIKESSFVQIYKDFGYKTYWISRNSDQKRVDTFCQEADTCRYNYNLNYDDELLPDFQKIIDQKHKALVVLHVLGSHIDYDKRVPEEDRIFKPLCSGNPVNCDAESLNNSYDNTIYYTDIFIAKIIEMLKDKDACIVFTSDHGESLGESSMGLISRYGHSTPYAVAPKEQTDVPLILWFSDKYLKKNKKINLKNMKNLKNISHDNIFDTLLGCGGISKRKRDNVENLNICDK